MSDDQPSGSFGERSARILDRIGAEAWLYAQNLETGASIGVRPDEPVVTASVFKIAVLLELHRQAAAGQLELTERVRVGIGQRVIGPTGLSCFHDDVEMSLRDLAVLMISISDNTATDVLLHRVGLDRVNLTLQNLKLPGTHLVGDCAGLLGSLLTDLKLAGEDPATVAIEPARLLATRALTASQTTRSTAREITALLAAIWNDTAAPAPACSQVRHVLGLQAWAHGLRAGLGPGMSFAGKSGTLPGIRNEAGVVTNAVGQQIAVAVFVRYPTDRLTEQRPDVDQAIADLGRLAVQAVQDPAGHNRDLNA